MNILMIMSDEHSYNAMGCSGHKVLRTPNLDKLATEGAFFSNCYTNSPLCVPARASWFTGKYVNRLGTWDNATAYDGKVKGISHYLSEKGYEVTSFGKTHFHADGDIAGFNASMPGWLKKLDVGAYYRNTAECKPDAAERFNDIKMRNEKSHDDKVFDLAATWLKAKKNSDRPWMLNIGYFDPHFPFIVKEEYWNYYNNIIADIPEEARAPFTSLNEPLKSLQKYFKCEMLDREMIRKLYIGYYASVAQLDENVGKLLGVLEQQGFADDTIVIYTSDHGEQLGCHGLWWKCCMFEESAHIPLIVKVPGAKKGKEISNPVSLVDILPTICEGMEIPVPDSIDGSSLLNLVMGKTELKRRDFVFSEYHGHGTPRGMYMIRWKNWKYVYYVGCEPQLFNLENDPHENYDLITYNGDSDTVKRVVKECDRRLREICNPEEVDERAREFQTRISRELGLDRVDFQEAINMEHTYLPHPESQK